MTGPILLNFIRKTRVYPFITSEVNGSISIINALMLPLLLGFTALSVDYGLWMYQKRQLQNIADISAIGGVQAIRQGDKSKIFTYAVEDAASNGFVVNADKTITVNNPPVGGTHAGNSNAVEVILEQTAKQYFSVFYLNTPPLIKARSVANIANASACVVALGTGSGVSTVGTGAINSSSCGIYTNSPQGVSAKGGSIISANSIAAVGPITGNVNAPDGIISAAPPVDDPLAALTMPTAGACNFNNFSSKVTQTINPGTYCGGMTLNANANVTMNPGTYIINGGSLDINAKAAISGNGVTFVLTGSSGNYASLTINGGAAVSLSAPTSGAMKGILFFGDRHATGVSYKFNGGATNIFDGTIYAPGADVTFSGNSTNGGKACTELVVGSISVSGASSFSSGCANSVTPLVGTMSLVE